MDREAVFEMIETTWDECQARNVGSNEAELDFMETLADWIDKNAIVLIDKK